jgi:hypothetical protein
MTDFKPTKTELLQHIETARGNLAQTLQPLSEAQIIARPDKDWSIKDHVAHLIPWIAGMSALLRHQDRWAAMGLSARLVEETEGFDAVNHALYEQYKDWSWAEVLAGLDKVHRGFEEVLADLTDEDLLKSYSYYESHETGEEDKRPIIGWLVGNTFEHYEEHQEWIEAASCLIK